MRRIISLIVVALVMAAMMVAMALPAFAKSFASDQNEVGGGPNNGINYGHCNQQDFPGAPGQGQSTAQNNPSYHGGKDKQAAGGGSICPNLSNS